jgi:hypothetical protein
MMQKRITHHKIIIAIALLFLIGIGWLIVRAMPATETDLRRSACYVDGNVSICLVNGKDTAVLTSDSVHQQGVWINRHWWLASCDGRVLTLSPTSKLRASEVPALCDSLSSLLNRKETERKELIYYLRSHGVIDEGYTQIATYASRQSKMTDSLKIKLRELQRICPIDSNNNGKHFKLGKKNRLILKTVYHVSWYNNSNKLKSVSCDPVYTALTSKVAPLILHTHRSIKPWGVYAVRNVPWGAAEHRKIVTVRLVPTEQSAPFHSIIVSGKYWQGHDHDLPRLFAVDGAPVFTKHGRFIGIIHGKEVLQ